PDPATAVLDPFSAEPTLSLICEIADPVTREPYHRDPRRIARRAEEHLLSTGIADTANFGPECEFFVFDEVSFEMGINASHYAVDSAEGHWNSGKPGLGYTVREKEGYFPPAPHDTLADLRTAMVLTLEQLGIPCEFHHHEVASGGPCEIAPPPHHPHPPSPLCEAHPAQGKKVGLRRLFEARPPVRRWPAHARARTARVLRT